MVKKPRGVAERAKEERDFLRVIGKNISSFANKREISIERLAYESGVSKGFLYDIVKGQGNPSAIFLFKIAASLEVPVQMLLK